MNRRVVRSVALTALALLLTGCLQPMAKPISEWIADESPEEQARFNAAYGDESYGYGLKAFQARLRCKIPAKAYEVLADPVTKVKDFKSLATALYHPLSLDIGDTSELWSQAIEERLNFNRVLMFKVVECQHLKGPESLQKAMDRLKAIAKGSEDKRIFEVMAALQEKATSPSGSRMTYNQAVNALRTEYSRAIASYGMK